MIAKSNDKFVTHNMKWGNTDHVSTRFSRRISALYYFTKEKGRKTKEKCSVVCVLVMSRVCVMYICLVLNCFVFFGVYRANYWNTWNCLKIKFRFRPSSFFFSVLTQIFYIFKKKNNNDTVNHFSLEIVPAFWMSQTSFILDKPVLSVHARIFWSFADSFCVHAPYQNK